MVNEGIGESQKRSSNGKIDECWLGPFVGSFKAIRLIASRESGCRTRLDSMERYHELFAILTLRGLFVFMNRKICRSVINVGG